MPQDPLDKAVTKAEPTPQRAPRASEEFYSQGPMSAFRRQDAKRAALKADVDDYTSERGMNTRGTRGYAHGGKVAGPNHKNFCKGGKVISSRKM